MDERLYIDTETYSELDIKKVGAHRYAYDVSTELMLTSFAFDDDDPTVIDHTDGEHLPKEVETYFGGHDDGRRIIAHNSFFDRHILRARLGLEASLSRWHDTMVKGYSLGLPGSLEALGRVVGLDDDNAKLQDGKKLIQLFCKPAPKNHKAGRYTRENKPEEWKRFKEYARQDITAMRAVDVKLPNWNLTPFERQVWVFDQEMNDRGLPIDLDYARKAIKLCESEMERLNEELAVLTFGAVKKHSELAKMEEFLRKHFGVRMPNMQAETLKLIVDTDIPEPAKKILRVRIEAGRSSTSKYAKLGAATSPDGCIHGAFQLYGAPRTLRWAGRLFQPQNLPRPDRGLDQELGAQAIKNEMVELLFDNPISVAASCVRGAIQAKQGKKLVVSDLSNIEGRGISFLAGEEWKLQAFRDFDLGIGPDIYIRSYAESFRIPVSEVLKDHRQIGKVIELALGYQGWIGAFESMAANNGVDLPEEQVVEICSAWRKAHPNIVNFWAELELAFMQAIRSTKKNVAYKAGPHIKIKKVGKFVLVWLPTGRYIPYYNPRIKKVPDPHRHGKMKDAIEFTTIHEKTRQWIREDTYGGKLAENATQALCRDILARNKLKAAKKYDIVGSIHDEAVAHVPDTEDFTHQELSSILATPIPELQGFPLAAAGYESYIYKKD